MSVFKKCLNNLTLSELTDKVGKKIVEGLHEFEIPITEVNLVNIILNNVFNKVIAP